MFRKLVSNLPFSPSLVGQLGFYAKRLRKEEFARRTGLVLTTLALIVQSLAVFAAPQPANAASPTDMVYGGLGRGSERSLDNFLDPYDKNTKNLRDIMNYAGITRDEIKKTEFKLITVGTGKYSWGLEPAFSYAQGERAVKIRDQKSGKVVRTAYARPFDLWHGPDFRYYAYVGQSEKLGWFAILQSCGNLVTTHIPPEQPAPKPTITKAVAPAPTARCDAVQATSITRTKFKFSAQSTVANGATVKSYDFTIRNHSGTVVKTQTIKTSADYAQFTHELPDEGKYRVSVVVNTTAGEKTDPDCEKEFEVVPPAACPLNGAISIEDDSCQPCVGDNTLWIKDSACAAQIVKTKQAENTDQAKDATAVVAKASERIIFTITAKNEGKKTGTVELKDRIYDNLEYASVVQKGGATFDEETKTLDWGTVTLKPGESATRSFTMQVLAAIPAVAKGNSDGASYDCMMTNTFGTTTNIDVDCPGPKVVEAVAHELPKTGAGTNIVFIAIVLTVVTYFYARSRQLKQEVRLVRRELTTGAI